MIRKFVFIALIMTIVATVNGQEWSPVGGGIQSQFEKAHNNVYALEVYKDELYAAGSFTQAGGKAANYIAKWNGVEWLPVGEGMNATVSSLRVYKGELYAGGWFTKAGTTDANRIAKWNGERWEALGKGLDSHPNDLVIYKDELYVAGEFSSANGSPARNIAKWNGLTWSALGKGVDVVRRICVYNDMLYTGGWAFDKGSKGINRWDGAKWTKPGFEVTGVPNSMIVFKDNLYVGGYFPKQGKKKENCMSQYDGSKLTITGKEGTNGHVYAMLIHNDELYTAGFFTEVEGQPTNNIAKWNGQSWTTFTPGVDFHPQAMVIYKDHVYAAGGYQPSESGTIGKNMIAKMPVSALTSIQK